MGARALVTFASELAPYAQERARDAQESEPFAQELGRDAQESGPVAQERGPFSKSSRSLLQVRTANPQDPGGESWSRGG